MQRLLAKRSLRNLKKNFPRYGALLFMIILALFLVVGTVVAAGTALNASSEMAEETNVEDGHFTTFVPLTAAEEDIITDESVTLEQMFSADYTLDDDSTVRLYKNRHTINKLKMVEGNPAQTDEELAIERRYAEEHALSVGDTITVAGKTFTISGIAVTSDYEGPFRSLGDTAVDSVAFGVAWVTDAAYDEALATGLAERSEEFAYAYVLNDKLTADELKDIIRDFPLDLKTVGDKYFKEYWATTTQDRDDNFAEAEMGNLESFVKADENPRIGCIADDQAVNIYTGYLAGIIVLMLFAYVIAIFVVHEIERDSTIIGSLYALGVTRKDLLLHYLQVPVIVTFVGGVIGLLLGMSQWSVDMTNEAVTSYYSVPNMDIYVPSAIIVYALLAPSLIAIIVNCLVISRKLNQPALTLIRNEKKQHRVSQIKLNKLGFVGRFRIRQLIREFRGSLAVVGGLFITYLLLIMGINCYVLCHEISVNNTEDVKFSNMYMYKYPPAEVPDGGEEAYSETFKMETLGIALDVTLLGINEDNPYFDVNLPSNGSDVVIADSVATKFGLSVGDTFVMEDPVAERYYAFEVVDIIPYSPNFFVFMDIDEMRGLIGAEDDYFNTVFSSKDLDIPTGQLFSTITAQDIKDAAAIFLSLMGSMITMMTTASILILVIIMYLMMRVAIDRSAQSIALFRVFGYEPREIRKLYLDGNFFVTAIGAAIVLPLAKVVMDALYPSLVFNVSCGIYLTFPWWYFAGIYGGTLILYLIISMVLVRRIKKITPAVALKNRE